MNGIHHKFPVSINESIGIQVKETILREKHKEEVETDHEIYGNYAISNIVIIIAFQSASNKQRDIKIWQ